LTGSFSAEDSGKALPEIQNFEEFKNTRKILFFYKEITLEYSEFLEQRHLTKMYNRKSLTTANWA
jgi:hypothetical protein